MIRLINDAGRNLLPTERLQAAFGTRMPVDEFADFMVRNMGWVALRRWAGALEVRARPAKARDLALAVAVERMRTCPAKAFFVSTFDRTWSSHRFDDQSDAVVHLMATVGKARAAARDRDFLSRSQRRSELATISAESRLLEAWIGGERRVKELSRLADTFFDGRFIVAGRDAAGDTCVLANGRDFNLIGDAWMSRLPRFRLVDWPDVAYGSWVERGYQEAWRSDAPSLDVLDCTIEWPQLGRKRHRYARILLPCRSDSGAKLLVGAMRNDPLIDLRAQLH